MKIVNNKMIISLVTVLALGTFSTLMAGNNKAVNEKASQVNNKPQKEWYVSTRVSVYSSAKDATYEGTNPSVFGRLSESVDGYDRNDVFLSIGSESTHKAAVVFIHTDWEERSGEYYSNYHDTKGLKDSWEMTVFSSVPDGEVTLTWDGLYVLTAKKDQRGYDEKKMLDSSTLEDLHLVDTKTGEVIDAVDNGKLNSYTFSMNADDEGSRTFVWAVGRGNSYAASKSVKQYIKAKQKEEREKAKEAEKAVAKHGHKKFGLPPM